MKHILNSVLMLITEILKEGMTKSLNQDKLENTYSVLRQKEGNNNNLSVAEVNNIMTKIMVTKIVQSSSFSNCEPVQDEIMQVDADFEPDLSIEHAEPSCNKIDDVYFDSHICANCFLEDVFDNFASINFELVSMRYFIGYVAFKVV